MARIVGVYFLPPLAIGRLGRSDKALANYVWRRDPTIHGASRNVIEPALTFELEADATVTPVVPSVMRFRDGRRLRPVAPFFELWASLEHADGSTTDEPLTSGLLEQLDSGPGSVLYSVVVANHKAARRSGDPADVFEARTQVAGDDFTPRRLDAATPPTAGAPGLVQPERPIPLGSFQVVRPVRRNVAGVDLDVMRVRFTPARGEVYGPPDADVGRDARTGRTFRIVKPENRILNPAAAWTRYNGSYDTYRNPEPWDTYDGADEGSNLSWGVVDDTCDGVISALVVVDGTRFLATARIAVGPPDYAPDRRPFLSIADDLADRDLEPATREELLADEADTQARIADLFERVWETAQLTNLDAIRARGINQNGSAKPPKIGSLPYTDDTSFRPADAPYADEKVAAAIPDRGTPPGSRLSWSDLVPQAHDALADEDALVLYLLTQAERVRQMVRPAYGKFADLPATVAADAMPDPSFRDPRVARDLLHDMRMPPYMRDEMAQALGLTRRQFEELMAYLTPSTPHMLLAADYDESSVHDRLPAVRRVRSRLSRPPTDRGPVGSPAPPGTPQ